MPVWRMISATPGSLRERACGWQAELRDGFSVVETRSAIGGGSLPGETLPTWALALDATTTPGGADGNLAKTP